MLKQRAVAAIYKPDTGFRVIVPNCLAGQRAPGLKCTLHGGVVDKTK